MQGETSQADSFFKQAVSRTDPTVVPNREVGPEEYGEGVFQQWQERIGLNYNLSWIFEMKNRPYL